ncbi:hypothetical protein BGZ58_005698, partial [Dissophora ornata]
MATVAAKKTYEVVLSVVSSILTDDPANNTATVQISDHDYTSWNVRLSRKRDTLTVHVGLEEEGQARHGLLTSLFGSKPPLTNYHDNLGGYRVARLVPHKNPRLSKTLSLGTGKLICGGAIEGDELSSSPIDPPKRVEAISKNYDVMQILLKDIYSVDVCFVFDCDKTYSNAGLWAHRSILSRYKTFAKAILEASCPTSC